MGYESRVYVVQEYKSIKPDGLGYGDVIAMFDLCKMGWSEFNGKTFPQLFNQERTCEFYDDDGNTIITTDNYGDEIRKANPKEVISWLKKYNADNEWGGWYRAEVFYKFLMAMEKTKQAYSLYHFGY